MTALKLLDVVTLRQSVQAFSQVTGETVTLPPGQVGTVVEVFTPEEVMVEFDRNDGDALALVSLKVSQLEHVRSQSSARASVIDRASPAPSNPRLT